MRQHFLAFIESEHTLDFQIFVLFGFGFYSLKWRLYKTNVLFQVMCLIVSGKRFYDQKLDVPIRNKYSKNCCLNCIIAVKSILDSTLNNGQHSNNTINQKRRLVESYCVSNIKTYIHVKSRLMAKSSRTGHSGKLMQSATSGSCNSFS